MTAIVVLTEGGMATARRIAEALPEARIHGPAGKVAAPGIAMDDVAPTLRRLFTEGTPIVGICAAGILIRTLAPLLDDKTAEPPVLAVAEDGAAVVPLLGGHRGANDLAGRLAAALGGMAAITTAGDRRFGVALDAPPAGWRLANPQDYKGFAAALLGGATVRLDGAAAWLAEARLPWGDDARLTVLATDAVASGGPDRLVYHPMTLAVGVGCERNTAPKTLIALVRSALAEAGLAEGAVAGVFSLDLKADEAAVHAVAAALDVPARFFPADRLEAETPRLANPSDVVFREVGCHGVAEGAALAAAGPHADLVLPKRKGAGVTCAIARAPEPIDTTRLGRPRGHLAIVGTGPGGAAWRTPETEALVAAADSLVGYGPYLDLLGPLAHGKTRRAYALGEEEDRVRTALDLAAEGQRVALVSSGDPGIYAMASLAFELIDREHRPDWRRVEIAASPGVSAMQLAAARTGAPLGHDFCAISLSDLLTPWDTIDHRLRAASEGDFVIALYNPASQRRREQLPRAREILLAHRPADTPVILARDLGRDGETVQVTDLGSLAVDLVDMQTVVIVGARSTRRFDDASGGPRVYTPRGYSRETAAAAEPAPAMVHFIGAGPGAPDLLTIRGRTLIATSQVCLYAGSLVPPEVVAYAPPGARVIDTAPLTLEEILGEISRAHADGRSVARVHSGDPSLYGAIAEQMRQLDRLGIPYDITPGVPAYTAAAAALKTELTLPEISQTIILTRTAMQTSPMPQGEDLGTLAATGATLAIHLSIRNLAEIRRSLEPHYGPDGPVAVVHRASWPDQLVIRGTLRDIEAKVRAAKITRTALILVGGVLAATDFPDSALYSPKHAHVLRPKRRG